MALWILCPIICVRNKHKGTSNHLLTTNHFVFVGINFSLILKIDNDESPILYSRCRTYYYLVFRLFCLSRRLFDSYLVDNRCCRHIGTRIQNPVELKGIVL